MTAVVVIVVLALVFAAASGRLGEPYVRDDEQLRRDEEDIAIYGAVVRPPIEREDRRPEGDEPD